MSIGPSNAIIISASSDIGAAMALRWLERGWRVSGTFRTSSGPVAALERMGANLVKCDLASRASVRKASAVFRESCPGWDVLVQCAGSMEPIGRFDSSDFEAWGKAISVNFTHQLALLHALLPSRSRLNPLGPCVLFFAGGGSNSAPLNYSAYTVSKIALTKMCELLDAEIPDVRFAIVGPGWVRTKIHQQTLRAGEDAGSNFQRTVERLAGEDFTSMDDVLDCCEWIIQKPRAVIGGRNFSVAHDPWGTPELESSLAADSGMYKLRRAGNTRFQKSHADSGPGSTEALERRT